MNKKVLVLSLFIGLIIVGVLVLLLNRPKSQLSNPLSTSQQVLPSETFIEYAGPSGFTFSYPNNLSLTNNEVDDNTYADILLSAKGVNGSLNLKITDSKFASINDWLKLNQGITKEVKLGNLKALELKTTDRLLLGALDQGVLFTIEMPLVEEDFWMEVYNKILSGFTFASPSPDSIGPSSDEVIFEGEEVVE